MHDFSEGDAGAISTALVSGRHIAMLPSRGLRPAQIAPLASRQSAALRSTAARKVRIPNGSITRLRAVCTSASRLAQAHDLMLQTHSLLPLQRQLRPLQALRPKVLTVAVLIAPPHGWPRGIVMSNKPGSGCTVEGGRRPLSQCCAGRFICSLCFMVCAVELGKF